jgi:DNA primase
MDRGKVLPLFFTPALLRRLRMEMPTLAEQLDKEFSRRRLRADYLIDKKEGGDGTRYLDILQEDLSMLQAEDSLFYRYGVQKGMEQGVEEGFEQGLEECVEKALQKLRERALSACRQRFPGNKAGLLAVAERLRLVPDSDGMVDFLLRLSSAKNLDDALALLPAPKKNGHRNGR